MNVFYTNSCLVGATRLEVVGPVDVGPDLVGGFRNKNVRYT